MDKLTLARKIHQTSKVQGQFTLRSGQQTNEYFDKYLFEAQPKLLSEIAAQLVSFIPKNIDVIAGLEMGGIPLATALSLQTDIALLFVRKEAKTYGTCKLAEGGEVKGKQLLIVEDVVTSGGAIVDAVSQLRKLGATVNQAICVIDREDSGRENLQSIGIQLNALFTKSYLESA
jgi:orotate phosphoribosyltransferase